ncbi:hypothetical protein FLM55_08470 [Francisella sp. Scap27]|uniref:hypothetical protein n=1 Tax=Francisella sp. Scap27 TaxID=2589986 RepID=UPI0015B9C8D1|nr:hypothetical protein [Francisella sp. Scap27]QLE79765.1 hypothetical protein FLM55_08470 [Francisella sp. Scap27]
MLRKLILIVSVVASCYGYSMMAQNDKLTISKSKELKALKDDCLSYYEVYESILGEHIDPGDRSEQTNIGGIKCHDATKACIVGINSTRSFSSVQLKVSGGYEDTIRITTDIVGEKTSSMIHVTANSTSGIKLQKDCPLSIKYILVNGPINDRFHIRCVES